MLLDGIFNKLKEMFRKMVGIKDVEQALKITPNISNEMVNAINLWDDMYKDQAPWLRDGVIGSPVTVRSLGLPSFIASEKARMAVLELRTEITEKKDKMKAAGINVVGKPSNSTNDIVPDTSDTDTGSSLEELADPLKQLHKSKEKKNENTRAKFLDKQYDKVRRDIRRQLEYGMAKGGLVIKPYPVLTEEGNIKEEDRTSFNMLSGNKIEFDYIQADGFYPIAFDGSGRITEAAFAQRKVDKEHVYTRLEHHKLVGTTVTITNKAYKTTTSVPSSMISGDLGSEIPLTEVPEWADIEPVTTIAGVDRLLFAYFKMPEANTIDTYSPLGVSCFSRAVKLIEEADKQYSRMLWEFEGGELAIDVDRDALRTVDETRTKPDGTVEVVSHTVNSVLQDRLFRKVDLNSEETYNVFNPTLRDQSLLNGLNTILMRIEDTVGFARGTIADVTAEARTATELKMLKQRSYASNADIQKSLEDTLRDVIYVMDVYCSLYHLAPEGEYDVSFEWDDSLLVDTEQELGKRVTLLQNGLASKVETRMWYFGETEEQAQEALYKIQLESQIAIQQNAAVSHDVGEKYGDGMNSNATNKPVDNNNKSPLNNRNTTKKSDNSEEKSE